jgi:hypothetical protein
MNPEVVCSRVDAFVAGLIVEVVDSEGFRPRIDEFSAAASASVIGTVYITTKNATKLLPIQTPIIIIIFLRQLAT